MKNRFTSRTGFVLGVCLMSMVAVLSSANRVSAQQGVYVTQASARLTKLIDTANQGGYKLHDNSFSIGGGWLKQSTTNWVPLFYVNLKAGTDYRFLAAGDNDAKDVDLELQDPNGKIVAQDGAANADATVNYRPSTSGKYLVRVRLFASRDNVPAVCLAIVMAK